MIVQPSSIDTFIKRDNVIDTNVLLQAYQWKGIEMDAVLDQLAHWRCFSGRVRQRIARISFEQLRLRLAQ
nr:hypothetical protein [Paenibacillus sp. 7541]